MIGFTGTQFGMSEAQIKHVEHLLTVDFRAKRGGGGLITPTIPEIILYFTGMAVMQAYVVRHPVDHALAWVALLLFWPLLGALYLVMAAWRTFVPRSRGPMAEPVDTQPWPRSSDHRDKVRWL